MSLTMNVQNTEESKIGLLHDTAAGNHTTPLLPVTDLEETTHHPTQTPPQSHPDYTDHHLDDDHHVVSAAYRPALETSKVFDFTGHVDVSQRGLYQNRKLKFHLVFKKV